MNAVPISPSYAIEAMHPADWPVVQAIYQEGILAGTATFETQAPDWEAWDHAHLAIGRLVARETHGARAVLGWAALSPYSSREAYAGVAGVSIYVAGAQRGRGLGRALLGALIEQSEAHGLWTLQAGIFTDNLASLALHQKMGFRLVGVRHHIGRLHGQWKDVALLERRSPSVGYA